jgi:hypothetical protein
MRSMSLAKGLAMAVVAWGAPSRVRRRRNLAPSPAVNGIGTDFRGNFTVSFGAWDEIVIPCGACIWFWAYLGLTPRAKLCRPSGAGLRLMLA